MITTINEFRKLNEGTEGSTEMSKLAKILKFPAGHRVTESSIVWNKRGGHAGAKSVSKTTRAAEELGWSRKSKQSNNATGDVVHNTNDMFDPEGLYKLSADSTYGSTTYDNWFSLRLTKI